MLNNETKGLDSDFASDISWRLKRLGIFKRKDIFNQQTILIKKINKMGSDVFGNFVENYRNCFNWAFFQPLVTMLGMTC